MHPLETLINLDIESKGFYTKPLGFMYDRYHNVSDFEEQIRVYPVHATKSYHVLEGILYIEGNSHTWMTTKEHNIESLELLDIFLSSKESIY